MKESGGLCIYTSTSPFTCFLSVWLTVKLIMDYSGGRQVLPLFFHKKGPDESDDRVRMDGWMAEWTDPPLRRKRKIACLPFLESRIDG